MVGELRLAPAVAGRVLGGGSISATRGLEQHVRGHRIVPGIVSFGEMKVPTGAAA